MKFDLSTRLRLVVMVVLLTPVLSGAQSLEYQRAEAAIRHRQWDAAIQLLRPVLETHPDDPVARNLLGEALTGQGNLREADKEYRKALSINPRFHPALINLATNEARLKQFAAAERDFRAALALVPEDPRVHMYLGSLAYLRDDFRSAARYLPAAGEFLDRDLDLRLELADSYFHLGKKQAGREVLKRLSLPSLSPTQQFVGGYLLAREGFYAEAVPFFRAVSARYSDSYDAGFNLALCEIRTKQFPQAIKVLKSLHARGHKTSELDNLLAKAYEGNNQILEAIEALREATVLAPKEERNYIDLAALCAGHHRYKGGIEVANVGLHYLPNNSRLLMERGVLYALQGKLDLAEQDYERASRIDPDMDKAYAGLGLAYLQMGDVPRAIKLLRSRTQKNPNDPVMQFLLGDALLRTGVRPGNPGFGEAQAALEKSVKLDPHYARSRLELAGTYLKQGRVDEAIVELEAARRFDAKDTAVYAQLALAYRRKGENAQATAMLKKVEELNKYQRQQDLRTLERDRSNKPPQDASTQPPPPPKP